MDSFDICRDVVEAAEAIHTALGSSLFRETYTVCLAMELINRGYQVQTKRARLAPEGVDYLFINDTLRVDVRAVADNEELQSARIRKGTSNPINLVLNFATPQLVSPEFKEKLFSEIISIADTSPLHSNTRIQ
jgi:hypothetical protein